MTLKLIIMFATTFSSSLDASTLCNSLSEQLVSDMLEDWLDLGLFHVTAECDQVADVYKPHLRNIIKMLNDLKLYHLIRIIVFKLKQSVFIHHIIVYI